MKTQGAGRVLIHRRDGDKVHIVDGEIVESINKEDAARAHTVNGWDVQLHHGHLGGHPPSPQLQSPVVGMLGISNPQCNSGNHGFLVWRDGVRESRVMRIHNHIHGPLAVKHHLS